MCVLCRLCKKKILLQVIHELYALHIVLFGIN